MNPAPTQIFAVSKNAQFTMEMWRDSRKFTKSLSRVRIPLGSQYAAHEEF